MKWKEKKVKQGREKKFKNIQAQDLFYILLQACVECCDLPLQFHFVVEKFYVNSDKNVCRPKSYGLLNTRVVQ